MGISVDTERWYVGISVDKGVMVCGDISRYGGGMWGYQWIRGGGIWGYQ